MTDPVDFKTVVLATLEATRTKLEETERNRRESLADVCKTLGEIGHLITTVKDDGDVDMEKLTGFLGECDSAWWMALLAKERAELFTLRQKVTRLEEDARIRTLAREEITRAGR